MSRSVNSPPSKLLHQRFCSSQSTHSYNVKLTDYNHHQHLKYRMTFQHRPPYTKLLSFGILWYQKVNMWGKNMKLLWRMIRGHWRLISFRDSNSYFTAMTTGHVSLFGCANQVKRLDLACGLDHQDYINSDQYPKIGLISEIIHFIGVVW